MAKESVVMVDGEEVERGFVNGEVGFWNGGEEKKGSWWATFVRNSAKMKR